MNEYYTPPALIKQNATVRGDVATGENTDRAAVEDAFDQLPTELSIKRAQVGVDQTVDIGSIKDFVLALPNTFLSDGTNVVQEGLQVSFTARDNCLSQPTLRIANSTIDKADITDAAGRQLGADEIVANTVVIVTRSDVGTWIFQGGSPLAVRNVATSLSAVVQTSVDAYPDRRNWIINGGMDIWQRGITVTDQLSTNEYATADRWRTSRKFNDANMTVSQVTDTPDRFKYAIKVQRDSGDTLTSEMYLMQQVETADARLLQGQDVMITGFVKVGANFSSTAGLELEFRQDLVFEDPSISISSGLTGPVDRLIVARPENAGAWAAFALAVTVNAACKAMLVRFNAVPEGTAGADDWFAVTGMQISVGTSAVPFEFRTLAEELTLCRRFYELSYSVGSFPGDVTATGEMLQRRRTFTATDAQLQPRYARKRTTPVITVYSPVTGTAGKIRNTDTAADVGAVIVDLGNAKSKIQLSVSVTTAYKHSAHWTADAEL